MVDADDSHNQLARRSQVGEAVTTTLTLSDLPPELILRIASSLEVRDLLALRRVHFDLYELTSATSLSIPNRVTDAYIASARTNSSGVAFSATSGHHYHEL